jgi:transketolase N-terminal domain/subunit
MSLSSNEIANLSRISTLKMIHASKAAHLGSSLSVIDILSVLFGKVAKVSIYHGYTEYCGTMNSDHYPVVVDLTF